MKRTSRILAALASAFFLVGGLGGCGQGDNSATTVAASPVNEVDSMLNDYEKAGKQCRRLALKLRGGDVSVTVLYLDASDEFRQWPKKHAQLWAKMPPAQAQRAASIAAQYASFLPT